MINRHWWVVINFVSFAVFVLLAASLQSTFFYRIFGYRATIQVILVIMTYVCLTRKPFEAILFVLFACTTLGLFSTLYTNTALFAGICIFWGLRFFRAIVYSPSHVYFNWTALGAIFAFHLIVWLTGLLTETTRPHFLIVNWILEVLITALFAKLILSVCLWIDQLTGRLNVPETVP